MVAKAPSVLLVESDAVAARGIQRTLQGCGYAVHRVSSAEDATKAMRGGKLCVDLVLMDAVLGNAIAAGSEAVRVVLEQEAFPVVALVSKDADVAPEFTSYGCAAKEFSAPILDTTLQAALRAFEANQRRDELEDAASRAQFGVWEYDPDGSRLHGSEVVFEILGLDASESVSLDSVSSLYETGSNGTLVRAVELAYEKGRPFNLISQIQTPSGKAKWVRTQGQAVGEPGSKSHRVFGTVQDISEMRLLNRVTQESELTLNQVEEITHIGHWSVSLVDGSYYHSDEVKRIFGYEPSEYTLSVEEAIEAYHPDDRAEVIRLFNHAVETGEGYEFDLRIVQPSGDVRHVHAKGYTEEDERGKVTRVYGVFQDVTERVLAERALRESEASMKALVDGVRTAIVVHGKNGEVLLRNQMADRLLAPLTADTFGNDTPDPAWRFIFEDHREVSVEELPVSRILRTHEPLENVVMGCRDEDKVVWILVNGVPVIDKAGELSKIIISFVDITELKEIEERLHQSEKMRAIGQLAGGVAHDFNNQLTVMLSYAEILRESFQRDSVGYSCADGILSSVSRSAELTKQLLAFARKGKFVVTTVDINTLISEVVSMAAHSFDKKIRITHHANAEPATIAGDVSQIQNALLNLALNSRDAMPEGGELVFTTSRVTLDEQSLRSAGLDRECDEYLRITIRDTGVGMDALTKKQIFEPFFTTKTPGSGTGMGMASVYGTVKNHHGAIEVESEPGSGTTITIHFPFVLGERENVDRLPPETDTADGRILVIDDEAEVAAAMTMMLSRKGYEPTFYTNGRDALDDFRRSWRKTDVVLLDLIMPEMNGIEVLRALKAIDPDVRVILISGYSFTDEADSIRDEGAAAFVVKPVASGVLLRTVHDVIVGSRAERGSST